MKAPGPPAEPPVVAVPRPVWRRFVPLALLACLVVAVYLTGWHRTLSLDTVAMVHDTYQAVIAQHWWLTLLGYVGFYAAAVALMLPGALWLTFAGGSMFGWLAGGAAAVAGATTGASIVFWIARTAASEVLIARCGSYMARAQAGFRENALSYMMFLRLVPAFPFFIVNLVPAILGIPFRTYLTGTFFGIMPATFAFASIGAGFDSVVAAAKAEQAACLATKTVAECPLAIHLKTLVTIEMKIAFVLLPIVALIPIVVKKWRRRHARQL